MRRALALLILSAGTALPLTAQAPDTTGLLRAVGRAREALVALPDLWRITADSVDWLFVHASGDVVTERRGRRDRLVPVTLPTGAPRANMAFELDGRRVAMIMLPLGGTDEARTRLLVHEAMHTFQPEWLPHPGGTEPMEGGDFLDGPEGRTWLFLELRAITAALRATGDARRDAARDALLFRARRDSLAGDTERTRLDALELAEGIPEYTGWRLVHPDAEALAARLDSAAGRNVSWVRAIGYWTGPAYGFLLDALAGATWHRAWQDGERLPAILSKVLGSTPVARDLDARARHHGGDVLRRAEVARETARRRRLDSLQTRFVAAPALRVRPTALRVSFDPNGQFPLAGAGTVMTNFRWTSDDGAELVAPAGALVAPDWSWFQVPLGTVRLESGALAAPVTIEGDGWRLVLPAGWRVVRSGSRTEVLPPT